jgi:superfamily I DNA and RNA helicase
MMTNRLAVFPPQNKVRLLTPSILISALKYNIISLSRHYKKNLTNTFVCVTVIIVNKQIVTHPKSVVKNNELQERSSHVIKV